MNLEPGVNLAPFCCFFLESCVRYTKTEEGKENEKRHICDGCRWRCCLNGHTCFCDGGSHSVMRKKEPKDGSFFYYIKNSAYFL